MHPMLLGGVAVGGVDVHVRVGQAGHQRASAEIDRVDRAPERPDAPRRADVDDALALDDDGRAVERLAASAVDQEGIGENGDPGHVARSFRLK